MRRLLGVLVAAVLCGVAGAWLWAQIANPGTWTVTEQGLTMGEDAAQGQFSVLASFVAVGVGGGLLFGLVGALLTGSGRAHGHWGLVPVLSALSMAAALIAWRLGVEFGPPDPQAVAGLAAGDTVSDQLAVNAWTAFLAWPIGTLVGILIIGLGFGSPRNRGDASLGQPDQIAA